MSLTTCIKKAGAALDATDRAALLSRSRELRKTGINATDAGKSAVSGRVAELRAEMAGVNTAAKETESPPVASTAPAKVAEPVSQADPVAQEKAQEQAQTDVTASPKPQQAVAAAPVAPGSPTQKQSQAARRAENIRPPAMPPVPEKEGGNPPPPFQRAMPASPAQRRADRLASQASPQTGRMRVLERFASRAKGTARQGLQDAATKLNFGSAVPELIADSALPPGTLAAVNTSSGVIHFNARETLSRGEWTQVMAEELFHAADLVGTGTAMSASSERLAATGDIGAEAQRVYDSGDGLADYLAYPMMDAEELGPHRVQAELFARLAVLYHGDPALMRRELPTAYEAYHELFGLTQTGPDQFVLGAVPGTGRQAEPEVSVRAAAPDAARGEEPVQVPGAVGRYSAGRAASGGQRAADRGLESFQSRTARIFRASVDGAYIGASLEARASPIELVRSMSQAKMRNALDDLLGSAGAKVTFWDRSVGTQNNKRRLPGFDPVFGHVQQYLEDVSSLAREAADQAAGILPKLESWTDLRDQIAKRDKYMSKSDAEKVAGPVFEGTLKWQRGTDGELVEADEVQRQAAQMSTEEKGQRLLRDRHVTAGELKAWRASPLDIHDGAVRNRYEKHYLQPGAVFTDAELRRLYSLSALQIAQYRQFMSSVNTSLDQVLAADVMRHLGDKVPAEFRNAMMNDRGSLRQKAEEFINEQIAANPESTDRLNALWNDIADKYTRVEDLKARGYAPLMRFGKFHVHVRGPNGETQYFGLFESRAAANKMAREMRRA
jgi:hypothetical protein